MITLLVLFFYLDHPFGPQFLLKLDQIKQELFLEIKYIIVNMNFMRASGKVIYSISISSPSISIYNNNIMFSYFNF